MKSLQELNNRHGSDKGNSRHSAHGQTYLDWYDTWFAGTRDTARNILELGVRKGCSLRLWEEYFPNATIWGVDIDPACRAHERGRVKVLTAGQDDEHAILAWAGETLFDVIIDDASHINTLTVASLALLWPRVAPGGLYIIEDLATSYRDLTPYVDRWGRELAGNRDRGVDLCNDRAIIDELILDCIRAVDEREDVAAVQSVCGILVMAKGS